MSRSRLNIFIEPEHAKRLEDLAAHRGVSKSSVIAAALSSFLSPDGGDQREAAMAKRLDRLSRQFDRLERDQSILIETVALYVRYYLTVSIPVPEGTSMLHARRAGRAMSSSSSNWPATCSVAAAWCGRYMRRSSRQAPARPLIQTLNPGVPMAHKPDQDPGREGVGNAAVSLERRIRMLRTALGPEIAAALEDPEVVEVMLNPDGSLWVDRLGSGREPTGASLPAPVAERIIRLVAAHVRAEVHSGLPILSAELPETGERFLGVLPPVVRAPSFAIRKRALRILTLADYVADGVMTEPQAIFLRSAVRERLNIVVAGGTSTGKTTLANALLDEIAQTRDRVLILEDTVELQCRSDDHVGMRSEPGVTTMADLVRATLRLRPDRIVVGEVRGAEALDLLKAWGTGHPGGIATVHAGSALGALTRLEQLVQEVSVTVPRALIAEAVNVIVFIAGRGRARRVREVARVTGHDSQGYQLDTTLGPLPWVSSFASSSSTHSPSSTPGEPS